MPTSCASRKRCAAKVFRGAELKRSLDRSCRHVLDCSIIENGYRFLVGTVMQEELRLPPVRTTKEVAWGVDRLRREVSTLTGVPVDDLAEDADLCGLCLASVPVMRICGLM